MRRRWWWVLVVLVLLGAPVAWYLASPLFISRSVTEEFPLRTDAGGPPGTAPARILARGAFVDADDFHKGSGTALLAVVDGQRILRLEEFQVTNGPDLYVYLTAHPRPRSRAAVQEGFANLGRLKGNVGAQNYPIPAGTDIGRYRAVVIYCRAFHVVFATATLGASP